MVNIYDRDDDMVFQNDYVFHRLTYRSHLDFEDELLPKNNH
jgi:hypothetical protein